VRVFTAGANKAVPELPEPYSLLFVFRQVSRQILEQKCSSPSKQSRDGVADQPEVGVAAVMAAPLHHAVPAQQCTGTAARKHAGEQKKATIGSPLHCAGMAKPKPAMKLLLQVGIGQPTTSAGCNPFCGQYSTASVRRI